MNWDADAFQKAILFGLEGDFSEVSVMEIVQRMVNRLRFESNDAMLMCRHLVSHSGLNSFYETQMIPAETLWACIRSGIQYYDGFPEKQQEERNLYIYQSLKKKTLINKLKKDELESMNLYKRLLVNTTITVYWEMITRPYFFEN